MPTETQAPRLIDANALKSSFRNPASYNPESDWGKGFKEGVSAALGLIESAPTVETTDDVLARLPKNFRYTFETKSDTYEVWTRDAERERTLKLGYAKTPLEAVKKLEASLNQK